MDKPNIGFKKKDTNCRTHLISYLLFSEQQSADFMSVIPWFYVLKANVLHRCQPTDSLDHLNEKHWHTEALLAMISVLRSYKEPVKRCWGVVWSDPWYREKPDSWTVNVSKTSRRFCYWSRCYNNTLDRIKCSLSWWHEIHCGLRNAAKMMKSSEHNMPSTENA